ncbi:MAG: GNAT family N-acetyltransferase [Natronosporangium sp.]
MTEILPAGLVLRTAGPSDLDQIAALLTERGEPVDAVDHRLVVEDPEAGWSACAVVVDGDRVVSTATLLDETLWLAGVPIPAGQVELVATDREYEGRGLVRALMGWAHRRSAERGQLAQLMIGIPYFYRLFGYVYAIPIVDTRPLVGPPPTSPGHLVREATAADIPAMAALQRAAQAGADLRMPHSDGCWRWLVARDGSQQWLAERDGVPVATGRATPPDEGLHLAEIAALDPPAAYALLHHATELAGGHPVRVNDRPGTVTGDALAPYLGPRPEQAELYYLRVPDPAALLEHLRPVLSARLVASPLAGTEGEAVVTFFRSHVRFGYRGGEIGPIAAGGTKQWAEAAVAPDLVGPLLFGPDGFAGLSRRHPDVFATAAVRPLLSTLFPPVRSDILTLYLP